jgi:hypothetical protein
VSTDDRKIKFYDIHTWEVVMEVELQNPAVSLCSWKHVDTEMFGANNHCLTLICSKSPGRHPTSWNWWMCSKKQNMKT